MGTPCHGEKSSKLNLNSEETLHGATPRVMGQNRKLAEIWNWREDPLWRKMLLECIGFSHDCNDAGISVLEITESKII